MFSVHLDLSRWCDPSTLTEEAKKEMERSGQQLIAMTRAHITEQASQKLHARRELYVESLKHVQVNENTFLVILDGAARWIEDGLPEHNMLDSLLASPKAKRAKDGSMYVTVPFQHNKGPSVITPGEANLLASIKSELRKRQIPFGKVEKEGDKPRLGTLHSFKIDGPMKTKEGSGQGRGQVGLPIQGWSADKKSGAPVLHGVQVMQRMVKDKRGNDHVQRAIMTFRVASSKHRGDAGRWEHPGLPAVNLMDEGARWAQEQWDRVIGPELAQRIVSKL